MENVLSYGWMHRIRLVELDHQLFLFNGDMLKYNVYNNKPPKVLVKIIDEYITCLSQCVLDEDSQY